MLVSYKVANIKKWRKIYEDVCFFESISSVANYILFQYIHSISFWKSIMLCNSLSLMLCFTIMTVKNTEWYNKLNYYWQLKKLCEKSSTQTSEEINSVCWFRTMDWKDAMFLHHYFEWDHGLSSHQYTANSKGDDSLNHLQFPTCLLGVLESIWSALYNISQYILEYCQSSLWEPVWQLFSVSRFSPLHHPPMVLSVPQPSKSHLNPREEY